MAQRVRIPHRGQGPSSARQLPILAALHARSPTLFPCIIHYLGSKVNSNFYFWVSFRGVRSSNLGDLLIMMKYLPKIMRKLLIFVRYCFIINLNLVRRDDCVGELIAILSGKGGTGKTSVCAGVAEALALSGEKVLCVDCDVGLRNLDIALALSQIGSLSFLEVCRGEYPLDMAARHPVYPNLFFLTAPMNCPTEEIDTEAFGAMLDNARRQFSFVLLDAPAGIEAGFRLAARFADRIVLVTGPDPAAVRDAARAAEVLELMGKQNIRLVVNRISKKMAGAMNLTVDDIMDEAGVPLLGLVPEDSNVVLSAAFQQPLLGYTKRGAAAACRRIAKRLQGLKVPVRI